MSALIRQTITRQVPSLRTFVSSAVTRKDIVQDLYIREIKAYQPAPAAKDAHVGSVKKFVLPPKPSAPAVPTDLAADLAAYDAAEPVLADAPAAAIASTEASPDSSPEAFLSFLEEDLPKPVEHH